jgi:hypothetical protein
MNNVETTRRRPVNANDAEHGLTLVEVIFALAILAFMVSVNYKILIGVIASRQLIDDRREGMYIANSVLTRLTHEIQLAVKQPLLPPCGSAASGGAVSQGGPGSPTGQPSLFGESGIGGTTLTFQAKDAGQHIPDGGTHAGLVQITYRVVEDPEQKTRQGTGLLLVRDEIPNTRPLADACKRALHFPITSNLVSLRFRFFDAKTNEWTDAWTAAQGNRLPKIIEFTVALRTPSGKVNTYTSASHIGSANQGIPTS